MKEILEQHKTFIFGIVVISLIIFNLIVASQKPEVVEKQVTTKDEKTTNDEVNRIKVDIKGCVKKPGVYEFLDYQRVIDAINKAGGLTELADTSNINLSKKLEDEMVVYIYSQEQVAKLKEAKTSEEKEAIINKIENQLETYDPMEEVEEKEVINEDNNKVSINNGTLEELTTLPGIGESKASAIIEYRKKTKFEALEDLLNVSGIGNATYEQLKEYITL